MDRDVVIRVEQLGKRYALGGPTNERYTALRDVLADSARRLFRRRHDSGRRANAEAFWALKDVSFQINRGEVVGIVGRNGAGKSTLLKILSRITEPTEGRIRLRGRVASLLEVGTGFHPELTGRENIYLNGAILGMHRSEIRSKFDEIVAFAEVEKFLDTPVKRYSSGMYVRLAFAVAAHLEPEILIVDEVLAVGDAEFQKKCLGKMKSVAESGGRTVLFVSHQMHAVQSLCSQGIMLDHGLIQRTGSAAEVVHAYLSSGASNDCFARPIAATDNGRPKITAAALSWDGTSGNIPPRALLALKLHTHSKRRVALDVRLSDALNNPVGFGSFGTFDEREMIELQPGYNSLTLALPTDWLANGSYNVSLDLTAPFVERFDRVESCLQFDLERTERPGVRRVLQQWGYGSATLPITQETAVTADAL